MSTSTQELYTANLLMNNGIGTDTAEQLYRGVITTHEEFLPAASQDVLKILADAYYGLSSALKRLGRDEEAKGAFARHKELSDMMQQTH